ncbi:MAG: Uma2 family endonuclease [Polyangiaceae bacterium]
MTMVTPDPARPYVIDPDDPRAPPMDVWNAMTEAERRRVAEALPSDFTLDFLPPPEGDRHLNPKVAAIDTLGRHFRRVGRQVYVSGELPIYYPGERVFSADLIAVLDVPLHERDRWLVAQEGKGPDFALEIHVRGERRKDMVKNVERYARLGIPEYFVFDRARGDLHGFRLPSSKAPAYERLSPRQGCLESRVLGMDLTLTGGKLRFRLGDATVPDADELLATLGATLDGVLASKDAAERRAEELERRTEELEQELAAMRAEMERLRRGI